MKGGWCGLVLTLLALTSRVGRGRFRRGDNGSRYDGKRAYR